MITQGSRYAEATIITTTVNGKPAQVIVPSAPEPETVTFTVYVVTVSDTIYGLANQLYGDATLWWRIADANPEIIWWGAIAPGTRLRVPTTAA